MSVISLATLLSFCFLNLPDATPGTALPAARPTSTVKLPQAPQVWLSSYDEAKALAIRHKLPLVLHFDATWCAACRKMDGEVLDRPQVTALLGRSVIGVRVDADQNKNLIREFGVSTLPTEVVIFPDGTRGARHSGAQDLTAYVARLSALSGQNPQAVDPSNIQETSESTPSRSCLIVQRDGKMVGMGGFSPVTLSAMKLWKKGSDQFIATHEGVDYFLLSAEEVTEFNANPERFIPKMHGCDLVAMSLENRATPGSIEFGSFYQGKLYFFASLANRTRFDSNPAWYHDVMAHAGTANSQSFPFLKVSESNN